MAKRTWTLLNVAEDQFVEKLELTSKDVDGVPEGLSIIKRRLYGGMRDGVDVIEVDNGAFRFVVVPTRGMGLWRATLGEVQLGWQAPVKGGPIHPSLVRLEAADGLGWMDGFDELLARCGLESNGSPVFNEAGVLRYPLHGKIQNIPAHQVEVSIDDSGEITISGVVDESRLFCGTVDDAELFGKKLRLTTSYTTKPGEPGVRIVDTVSNLSAVRGEFQMIYHINVGTPLVNAGSKLVAPVAKVAPRFLVEAEAIPTWDTYPAPAVGGHSACLYHDLLADASGRTHVLLHNAEATQGVSIFLNKNQLPCFTQWKNVQAVEDGYVTGLEPGTNFPNERPFEAKQGRVVTLQGGESRTFEFAIEAHADAKSIAAAKKDVLKLQAGREPEVLHEPNPEWSIT